MSCETCTLIRKENDMLRRVTHHLTDSARVERLRSERDEALFARNTYADQFYQRTGEWQYLNDALDNLIGALESLGVCDEWETIANIVHAIQIRRGQS